MDAIICSISSNPCARIYGTVHYNTMGNENTSKPAGTYYFTNIINKDFIYSRTKKDYTFFQRFDLLVFPLYCQTSEHCPARTKYVCCPTTHSTNTEGTHLLILLHGGIYSGLRTRTDAVLEAVELVVERVHVLLLADVHSETSIYSI